MDKEIQGLLEELFKLIGIEAKFNIKEEEGAFKVEIDPGEEAGLLIGAHGTTLSAIQSFLTIAINRDKKQEGDDWTRVLVDVGGWGEKQNQNLVELANSTRDRAIQTGEEQKLYNLSSTQRRMVHLALKESAEVETLSEGEGENRYLIVRPKAK